VPRFATESTNKFELTICSHIPTATMLATHANETIPTVTLNDVQYYFLYIILNESELGISAVSLDPRLKLASRAVGVFSESTPYVVNRTRAVL
jgi:hypothetical protein